MDYKIKLTARDFNKPDAKYPDDAPYASSGQLYDLLAVAVTGEDSNDMENWEAQDAAIKYALKEYDWEKGFINALNAVSTPIKAADLLGLDAGDPVMGKLWLQYDAQKLLLGAWLALERAPQFNESLKDWQRAVEDVITECTGDYAGRKGLPDDLAKDLDKAYYSVEEDAMHEFLYGDGGRNRCGVYQEAEKKLFGSDGVDLDQNKDDRRENVLWATVDEERGRELVADWEGVELTKARVGEARVKAVIVGQILHAAERQVSDRKARSEKWKAERLATEAYQKARREREEKARREKLLAMTK